MDDAGARRHDAEVLERVLTPAEEAVALRVPPELELPVQVERVARGEPVDHDGVIDDEIDRDLRVDQRRLAAERGHRVAHRREIDDGRNPGEVLQDDARGGEGDLVLGRGLRPPAGERLDVGPGDVLPVLVPEEVLEQDLQREREAADAMGVLERVEAVDDERVVADAQGPAGGEAVHGAGLRQGRASRQPTSDVPRAQPFGENDRPSEPEAPMPAPRRLSRAAPRRTSSPRRARCAPAGCASATRRR